MCSTPLVVDDLLIVNPGGTNASLVALDCATGRTRWTTPGLPAAYSSFICGEFGGRRQIVGYDQHSLGGWDVKTGKRLWQLVPPAEGDFNVPTPIAVDGGVVVSTENNGTRLYRFDESGRIISKPAAEFADLSPDTVSPVVTCGRVFGAHRGSALSRRAEWLEAGLASGRRRAGRSRDVDRRRRAGAGDHAAAANSFYWTAGRTRAPSFRGCGCLMTTWRCIRIRRWWERGFTREAVPAWFAWTWGRTEQNDTSFIMKTIITLGMVALCCAGCSSTRQSRPTRSCFPRCGRMWRKSPMNWTMVSAERRVVLDAIATDIAAELESGKPAKLTFICTSNSRRSHMSQIWAQTAAYYYGLGRGSSVFRRDAGDRVQLPDRGRHAPGGF